MDTTYSDIPSRDLADTRKENILHDLHEECTIENNSSG